MTLQYLKYVLELRCSPGEYSAELKLSQRHMYKKLCGNNPPHAVNWLVFVAASQALEQTLAGIDELELLKEITSAVNLSPFSYLPLEIRICLRAQFHT